MVHFIWGINFSGPKIIIFKKLMLLYIQKDPWVYL
jgi:hypothetical protein